MIKKTKNSERVLNAIREIIEKNRKNRRYPDAALLTEIGRACSELDGSEIRDALAGLRKSGIIRAGRTINDYYVEIIDYSEKCE